MSYRILAGGPAKPGTARATAAWVHVRRCEVGRISAANVERLTAIISSDWSTGLDFVSTEDGLTMGFRRLAGSRLAKMLDAHGVAVKLPTADDSLSQAVYDWAVRLAEDHDWWNEQWGEWLGQIASVPAWCRTGRELALWLRARNSAATWVAGTDSYAELRARYLGHPRGPSRIARIESAIGAEEVWR